METTYKILPGMKVAVVGLGRAGQAVVRYLFKKNADILISDSRNRADLTDLQLDLLASCSAEYEGGGHSMDFLGNAEIIIVSPGVDPAHPVLKQAAESGIPVIGELALAAGKFNVPVIAISGTNGKTTVTELAGRLLERDGLNVFVGGNIGTPVAEYLLDPNGYDAAVLEVSSFQLELCGAFAPDVAVLLNITPDHLNRHGTLEKYAATKMNLFSDKVVTQRAIINGDDPVIGKYLHFAALDSFEMFGFDSSYIASVTGSMVSILSEGDKQIYDLGNSRLGTAIGCLNSAAALLAVKSFCIDRKRALETLLLFEQGRHRMQNIGEVNGVRYINDSKATNTGAVNGALEQVETNVILIAGGKEKGDDFCLLRKSVQKHVKKLILLGESAEKISSVLGDIVPFEYAMDMAEAVGLAASAAGPGDSVLLSPACASFDMFDSYAHRGDVFERVVEDMRSGIVKEIA